jgi:superfamily II DNA or RNA helicase
LTELSLYIKRIPPGRLRILVGQDICDAIVDYNIYINNLVIDYGQILQNKYGKNILFDRNVFREIIIYLDDKIIEKIAKISEISGNNIDEMREVISDKNFGYRNLNFSENLILVLDIDRDYYLPPRAEFIEVYDQVLKPNYHLHDYQKNLKDKAIQILLNPNYTNRMLIHMPTGSGKTKTAMELASDYLRCKSVLGGFDKSGFVIWIAHSKELNDQAVETFVDTWRLRGDYEIDIFKLYGDNEYPTGLLKSQSAFIFIGFQKFNAMINSKNSIQISIKKKILEKVKLVIVDEAHKSLASTYESTINLLTSTIGGTQLIGLTATPGRSSSHDAVDNNHLSYFFNSTRIGLIDDLGIPIEEPIGYLQSKGVLARIQREELITDIQLKLTEKEITDLKVFGDEKLKKILGDLSKNPGRNKLIIDKVNLLVQNDESILIFACNVEHCIILQTLLNAIGIEAGTILSTTSKYDREESIKRFKDNSLKVLINYGVLTAGFDAPNLNTLIIARPTTSIVLYSQMVGRALRGKLNGGHEINKIIDLRDNFILGNESDMFGFYDEIWNNK